MKRKQSSKCKCGHAKSEHARSGCRHITDKVMWIVCSCLAYRPKVQLAKEPFARWSSHETSLEYDGQQVAVWFDGKKKLKTLVAALNKHRVTLGVKP